MNIQMITAASTMGQLQKKVDLISHNIANIDTVGYKRREAPFESLLTQQINNQPHLQKEMGRTTPQGLRIGHGARIAQTHLRFEQGAVHITEQPLDVMIQGSGWFRILSTFMDENGNPQEELQYTRNGAFKLQPNPNNEAEMLLSTAAGQAVLDHNGAPISFRGDYQELTINERGTIVVTYNDLETTEFQLGIADIHRPDVLESLGENMYRLPVAVAANAELVEGIRTYLDLGVEDTDKISIRQGALEASNVDLTHEMSELLQAQRLLQLQARSISMANDMMGLINSMKG